MEFECSLLLKHALNFARIFLSVRICHTEALAEVSINLKCFLKFFGFFCCGYALQPVGSLSIESLK